MSCKHCNGSMENIIDKKTYDRGALYVYIEGGNMHSECYIEHRSISGDVEIAYCPMCGKKLEDETTNDNVEHPSHYNKGKYEVIDVIEDWQLDFALGNAIKYIARAEHKGKYKEDLKKAIFYLQREVDRGE